MSNLYDLIILGAGPSGMSAAIYAGRATLRTLLIDNDHKGGQIGITDSVVNYPGIVNISGHDLISNMEQQARSFGAEVYQDTVVNVNLTGDIKTVTTQDGSVFESLGLIIATGARPRTAGFKGEHDFTGHGIGYCATCDGEFFTGKDIFVIGGGFAAAEEGIFLTRYAKKVHILVKSDEFTCSPSIASKVLENDKIQVHFNTEMLEVSGDAVLRTAKIRNNKTGDIWDYQPEDPNDTFGIFVFAGYEPMTELYKDQVTLDDYGYIPTDEDMQTNLAGVYAAGDIRPKRLRQLATAVSDGAIASTIAEKHIEEAKERLNITIAPQSKVEQPPASSSVKSVSPSQTAPSSSFLDDSLREALLPILEKLTSSITLEVVEEEGSPKLSQELVGFAEDIANLSEKISVQTRTSEQTTLNTTFFPVLGMIKEDGTDAGVYFHGVPGGHEFNSFVLALYNVAGPGQEVPDSTLERIAALPAADVQIGATLSCVMCPDVVQAAQLIASHNPKVKAHMIDISQFPEFRNSNNIMSVPAVIVNGGPVSFGRKSLDEMIALLEQ